VAASGGQSSRYPQWSQTMPTDLTIGLLDQPGTLANASDSLGRAGINIEGACGFVVGQQGLYHVLVQDAERARRALMDSGFEILAERAVHVMPIQNRPGEAAHLLRRVAGAGINLDIEAIRRAIG
jgi:hypothetical protein